MKKCLILSAFALSLSLLLGSPAMSETNPTVTFETTKGNFVVELYPNEAPVTVANFLEYVNSGFFAGTIFHRVIPNFMVQGGGFTFDMTEKDNKNAPIKIESNTGLKNDKGTLAMARTNDPNSATSQFFVNVKDNDFLNFTAETASGYGYAVFGKVTEGMDVIEAIEGVDTKQYGPHGDVPAEPIIIEKASVNE